MYEIRTYVNSQEVEYNPDIKSLRTVKAMFEAKAHLLISLYGAKQIRYFRIIVYDDEMGIMECHGDAQTDKKKQTTGNCYWWETMVITTVKAKFI